MIALLEKNEELLVPFNNLWPRYSAGEYYFAD